MDHKIVRILHGFPYICILRYVLYLEYFIISELGSAISGDALVSSARAITVAERRKTDIQNKKRR